jgi:uncharacterized repeat protein (TIGR03803 family)
MRNLGIGKIACILPLFCLAVTIASPAQTFTTLFTFDGNTNGQAANAPLLQATDGNFYGTTDLGGADDFGGIFGLTPGGKLTRLSMFTNCPNCPKGSSAGLIQGPDEILYGTALGGAYSVGSVFKIAPNGVLTTIYSFCSQQFCPDGQYPESLVYAPGGNLYGTAAYGGTGPFCYNFKPVLCGTVFEMTPTGQLTTLYNFCSQSSCSDGIAPAALMLAANGKFYGTTTSGGEYNADCAEFGCGSIFVITPAGNLTTLHRFCSVTNAQGFCTDGEDPGNALIQGSDGNFYGTTKTGGANNGGTIFKMTPAGKLSTLYNFCSLANCLDGTLPYAGLVEGTDGIFYGTTAEGGANNNTGVCFGSGCGTIFKFSRAGQLTTLYNFCSQTNCADGTSPVGSLLQATDGVFYGSAIQGGSSNCRFGCGTVFSLSVGLGPFVEPSLEFGKVGSSINIMGNNLKGTTNVTFNGTSATFIVESGTFIKATVPVGATTGRIEVTTQSESLSSNVLFHVLP